MSPIPPYAPPASDGIDQADLDASIAALINGAPANRDTLVELATAITTAQNSANSAQTALTTHQTDTNDAHTATAISYAGIANNVGAALDILANAGSTGFLDVAETTSQSQANTNVYTDIFEMDIEFEGDGASRIEVVFTAGDLAVIAGTANPTTVRLYDVTNAQAIAHSYHSNPGASTKIEPVHIRTVLEPFEGTKRIKAQMKRAGAGTTTINANGDQPRVMTLSAALAGTMEDYALRSRYADQVIVESGVGDLMDYDYIELQDSVTEAVVTALWRSDNPDIVLDEEFQPLPSYFIPYEWTANKVTGIWSGLNGEFVDTLVLKLAGVGTNTTVPVERRQIRT